MLRLVPSVLRRRLLCRIIMMAGAVGATCHVGAAAEPVEAPVPELAGITRIKESVWVCAEWGGETKWLSAVGEAIGPFKLTGIDPETEYVEFAGPGGVVKVWLRQAPIAEAGDQAAPEVESNPLDAMLASMRERAAFVGFGDLSEAQKTQILMASLLHILNFPDFSPEKRRQLLSAKLNQERLMHIGPQGISEAEAAALGISSEKAAEMNRMHSLGPALRQLAREEGKPVALEID